MRYARVIKNVAIDVVMQPPEWLFTPEIAVQFTVVPDIEAGWVFLPVIVNEQLTADHSWHPPRTIVKEYEDGKFTYDQIAEAAPATFTRVKRALHITKLAFLLRFTKAEARAIDLASIGATQDAAAIRLLRSKLDMASFVDLRHRDVKSGLRDLEDASLLAVGRMAEILEAEITPEEEHKE